MSARLHSFLGSLQENPFPCKFSRQSASFGLGSLSLSSKPALPHLQITDSDLPSGLPLSLTRTLAK